MAGRIKSICAGRLCPEWSFFCGKLQPILCRRDAERALERDFKFAAGRVAQLAADVGDAERFVLEEVSAVLQLDAKAEDTEVHADNIAKDSSKAFDAHTHDCCCGQLGQLALFAPERFNHAMNCLGIHVLCPPKVKQIVQADQERTEKYTGFRL